MPSFYLNQCWIIVSWTLRNKHQWIFFIKIENVSFMKMHVKISSAKWWSFCPGGDGLTEKIKFKPFLTLRCDGWYKVWWYLMLHGELRVYFPGGTERVGLDWWELEIRNNVHKNREQAQLRKWWQEFASLPYDIVTCVRLHTEISDANVNNIATIQISHDFL